jgi:hypothetical protein
LTTTSNLGFIVLIFREGIYRVIYYYEKTVVLLIILIDSILLININFVVKYH